MSILVPDNGLLTLLGVMTSDYSDWFVGLTKTLVTPAAADTLTTYSAVESDFPGYARISVSVPTTPTVASDVASTDLGSLEFVCTGTTDQYVYNWFLGTSLTSGIIAAGTIAVPIYMHDNGDWVTVDLTQLLQNT